MKTTAASILALICAANLSAAPQVKILTKVNPLPVALSDDFQFRKTKLFELTVAPPKIKKSRRSDPPCRDISCWSDPLPSLASEPGLCCGASMRERQYNFGQICAPQ